MVAKVFPRMREQVVEARPTESKASVPSALIAGAIKGQPRPCRVQQDDQNPARSASGNQRQQEPDRDARPRDAVYAAQDEPAGHVAGREKPIPSRTETGAQK